MFGAFPCMTKKGCPKSTRVPPERFCPAWYDGGEHGIFERHDVTGDIRKVEGCFFVEMMRMLQFVVKYQDKATASIEKVGKQSHQDLATGLQAIIAHMPQMAALASSLTEEQPNQPRLEDHTE